MPIPEGCHTVNFVVGPPRPKDSSQSDAADADIFCLPTDSNAVIYSNSLMSFWQRNDDRMAFTGFFFLLLFSFFFFSSSLLSLNSFFRVFRGNYICPLLSSIVDCWRSTISFFNCGPTLPLSYLGDSTRSHFSLSPSLLFLFFSVSFFFFFFSSHINNEQGL